MRLILLFILLILISPWFFLLARNYNILKTQQVRNLTISDKIEEVNILQNQAREKNFGFLSRLVVNKYTFYFKDLVFKYLESFDADFLFFKGDLDLYKSTRNTGALHLSYLPIIVIGFLTLIKIRKNKLKDAVLALFFLTPLLAVLKAPHYETIYRIPFLVILTLIASIGFLEIIKYRYLSVVYILFLIFELLRFINDFLYYYPEKLT